MKGLNLCVHIGHIWTCGACELDTCENVGHHFQNTVAALTESFAYSYWANQAVFKRRDRLTLLMITPTKCWWRKVALPILQTPKKGLFSLVRSQMGWCVFGSISLSISIWPSYEWEQHDAYKNLYKSTITSQIQPGIPRTISLAMEIFWVISPCKNSKRNTDDWQQKPYGELMIALCMPPLVADELTKLLSTTFNITIPLTLVSYTNSLLLYTLQSHLFHPLLKKDTKYINRKSLGLWVYSA